MKTFFILATGMLLLMTRSAIAQYSDSSLVKKHELSIDLLPVLKIFSDPEQNYHYRGSAQYKYRLSRHWYFRFGFTLIKKNQPKTYSHPFFYSVDSIHDGVSFYQYIYKPEVQFNPGIEYRWGKKRLVHFTGLDIGYSYSETLYRHYNGLTEKYFKFDPNQTFPDSETDQQAYQRWLSYSSLNVTHAMCFTPFYGMQYHFSKRFFFSMQLGCQLQYLPRHKHMRVGRPLGIVHDFSIAYRF